MKAETVARLLHAAQVRLVRFEIADTHGIARSKTVPLAKFPTYATRGLNFYGGMLTQDAGGDDVPAPGKLPPLDYILKPDLDTLVVLPYAPGEARLLCDMYTTQGQPAPQDPRGVLKRVMAEFVEAGMLPRTGFEYEFYLIHRATRATAFPDRQICSTIRNNGQPEFRDDLFGALPSFGIEVSTFSVEFAPGQFEITFAPGDGVTAADQAFSFRTAVKEIARRHGFDAPFMTKPFIDEAASGCHIHHCILDTATGQNLFADPDGPHGLSTLATHFLGGIFHHAAALSAFLSPTPNDYKRYQPDTFAPINLTWGYDNRSAAIRIPAGATGSAARIETRIAGAASSPYLALAASLAAGLDGIQRKIEPPTPITVEAREATDAPPLPRSLEDALDALEANTVLRAVLGDVFIENYLLVKRYDVEKARRACPDYGTDAWSSRIDPHEWREYGELI